MVRGARDAVLPILRDARAYSTALQYSPAKPSSGAFSWLFGGGNRTNVPLSEPLPDVLIPKPDSAPIEPLAFQTSTLPSGTKIAAFDALGPLAGVALYVNAGSVNETGKSIGASFLISELAFRATKHRTTFRLLRELDKIGATTFSKAGRDSLTLALKVNKLHVPEAVEILLDAALNPRFNSWEVKDSLPHVAEALDEALKNPQTVLRELLHKAAFSGALGHALLPDVAALEKITDEALHEFHSEHFVPGKIVLVGAGLDLDKLQTFAQPLLPGSGGSPATPPASKYGGGFINAIAPGDAAHVAIAFEAPGGKSSVKSAATASVAAALFDTSKQVVPYSDSTEDILASRQPVLSLYSNTGLIGLAGSAAPGDSSKALDAISTIIIKFAKGVSETDVLAAKGRVLRKYSQSFNTTGTLEDVGTTLLTSGAYSSGAFASSVAAVTPADVSAFLSAALKSPATVIAYGNLGEIPRYTDIAKRFA